MKQLDLENDDRESTVVKKDKKWKLLHSNKK